MSFKSLEKYQQGACQLSEVMTNSKDQIRFRILREQNETGGEGLGGGGGGFSEPTA